MTKDMIPASEHNDLLNNYRLQHIRIESQLAQLAAQEAIQNWLKNKLLQLQGGATAMMVHRRRVDDSVMKNQNARLARSVQRFVSDACHGDGANLESLGDAIRADLRRKQHPGSLPGLPAASVATPLLLRHAISSYLVFDVLNTMQVSLSNHVNSSLTSTLPSAQPNSIAPAVWRIQTVRNSASMQNDAADYLWDDLRARFPALSETLTAAQRKIFVKTVRGEAAMLSRMIHGIPTSDVPLYRAFTPASGDAFEQHCMELKRECQSRSNGDRNKVGACTAPGIMKLGWNDAGQLGITAVVEKAEVICACSASPRAAPASAQNVPTDDFARFSMYGMPSTPGPEAATPAYSV
ncbi:hypothetical protein JCM10207_003752 [Rhodosporidiobolus poonsookiae]